MTTQTEAREAIYQAFIDGWGAASLYTFDNEDYTPPSDLPWVRLSVRHTNSAQETLGAVGNRNYLRSGNIIVQIFGPQDTGVFETDTLVETVRAIFEGVTLPGTTVRCYDCIVNETGPSGKWYQTIVRATFDYEETR